MDTVNPISGVAIGVLACLEEQVWNRLLTGLDARAANEAAPSGVPAARIEVRELDVTLL